MAKMTNSEQMKMIEEWVYAYQARIRAYLFSRTGHEAITKDLAQEVFLVAMRQVDQFDMSKEPWPWLIGIAHNKLREHWRGIQKRGEVEALDALVATRQLDQDEADVEGRMDEQLESLHYCLGQLQPRAKRLVKMIYMDRLSCAQVADRLKQKAGAVRITIHRLRKALRLCMESSLAEDGA